MKKKIAIMSVDDHPVARLAVANALADHVDLDLIAQADGPAALDGMLVEQRCDVLITDLSMPTDGPGDGLALLRAMRRQYPRMQIVVLSMYDSPALIRSSVQIGIAGFVSKCDDATCLVSAVRAAMRRERYLAPHARAVFESARQRCPGYGVNAQLTEREAHVLCRYLWGETTADIARSLGRSVKTVSAQRMVAMRKLWVETDADLFEIAAFDDIATKWRPLTLTCGTESASIGS